MMYSCVGLSQRILKLLTGYFDGSTQFKLEGFMNSPHYQIRELI